MKPFSFIFFAVAVVAGLCIGYVFGLVPLLRAPTDEGTVVKRVPSDEVLPVREVVALGRLEPAAGVLTVSGVIGDRLQELKVAEGEKVEAGTVLARLDSYRLRSLEIELARSQLEEAVARRAAEDALAQSKVAAAQLAQEHAKWPSYEVIAQREQLNMLELSLDQARNDLQRLERLSEELVSPQELEHQKLLLRKQEAEREAAKAKLQALEQAATFRQQQADTDLEAAEASRHQILQAIPVESLKQQVALAELQLEQAQITAPVRGTILKIFTQPGELIAQKPILQMADLEEMVCIAEVYETDVRHVRIDQPVKIMSQALDISGDSSELRGRVTSIGRMIMTPELKSLDPFAPVDRHVIEVRIALDEPSAMRAAQWVNLQVEATFLQPQDVREMAYLPPASP